MIGLIQRVTSAEVKIAEKSVASINQGLLVLVGIEKNDKAEQAKKLLNKLLNYRVFDDQQGKMNLSITDIEGAMLLVPQITLTTDTRKGLRPSFSQGATPEQGKQLFDYLIQAAGAVHTQMATGIFGADMQVSLTNDGPVTFIIHYPPTE